MLFPQGADSWAGLHPPLAWPSADVNVLADGEARLVVATSQGTCLQELFIFISAKELFSEKVLPNYDRNLAARSCPALRQESECRTDLAPRINPHFSSCYSFS